MIRTEQIDAGRVKGLVTHAERPRAGVLLLAPSPASTPSCASARKCWPRPDTLRWSGIPIRARRRHRICRPRRCGRRKLNDGAVDAMSDCVGHMLDSMKLPAVAVVGFCLGGRYAVLLGGERQAAVRLRAVLPVDPCAEPAEADARCGGALGRNSMPGAPDPCRGRQGVQAWVFALVRAVLEQRAVATMVEIHPGAVHSFMRPDLQGVPANASASRLSWPQVVAFLRCLPRTAVGGLKPAQSQQTA